MSSEYKSTLNLPKTKFPMKANLSQRESERLKQWHDLNLYHRIREKQQGKPQFILHDGPPYANGHLHMGHALNKVLKDIVVKSKIMNGFDAPFVPGWDCHGLPIEHKVEQKIGKVGDKVDAVTFRAKCRAYADEQVNIQREEFKRLGVLGDWDDPYKTMDKAYEANIVRALKIVVEHGHLQQGEKPVYWCLDCQSSLAEAEVEYKDKGSPAIDVRFKAVDVAALAKIFDADAVATISFPIWTTTPWTLPSNQLVMVHPEAQYALVKVGEEAFVLAKDLVDVAMQRFGYEDYTVLGTCEGNALDTLLVQHPFYDRTSVVAVSDHVTMDTGTGCVHGAPDHGADDYAVAQRYDIGMLNYVGGNGVFNENTPLFAGQFILKANKTIVELLVEKNALLKQETLEHSYPHCWRHKTPLIFRATPQWFVSMEKQGLREAALKGIKSTQWIPAWGENRLTKMIENRPDWCISRQRAWGTPMPLLIHAETRELHPETLSILDRVADKMDKEGIEVWFSSKPTDWVDDGDDYEQCTDILEVWFEAGVSHFAVLAQREELRAPADLYLEGSDQHRGWFNSSLMTGTALYGQPPYHQVLTHGFALDGQGRKMSKSLGNTIAPEKIINSLGADILRLWVASTDYRDDVNVSDEILKRTADSYRRIRNTARFLLSNLEDFDPAEDCVPFTKMLSLDRWIVDTTGLLQQAIIEHYETYEFHLIVKAIHEFCASVLGGFYLDIIKDRQYTTQTVSLARRSAQTAMYYVLEAFVRWIAPVLSFTADEIWQFMPGEREGSVFLSEWFTALPGLSEDDSFDQAYWQTIMQVRAAVNIEIEQQRNADKIGSGLEAVVDLYCEPELLEALRKLKDELRFVLITSNARVHFAVERDDVSVKTEVPGLWLKVTPSVDQKCDRCWHRRDDVGVNAEHPALCGRCVENVVGSGEERAFA